MSLKFEVRTNKIKIANGLYRFHLPKCIQRIMPEFKNKKEKGDWVRKFLDINNAIFFSEDVNSDGLPSGESICVLDVDINKMDPLAKVIICKDDNGNLGVTGKYIIPYIAFNTMPFNINHKELIEELDRYKEIRK